MKSPNYFKTSTFLALILFISLISSFGQTPNFPAPREEKLLNGMKLLVWNAPKSDKITLKLRIHSGSAFDPLGKEGVMQLLSDILFPNESIKDFFADDLGGSLEIISNYDYIQINATGNNDQFLTILQTISQALTNPQINKETTEIVRPALLAKVKELEKDPSYIADQAVAKRLLGNFPYGRPQLGSSESIAKIDFADLIFAREKFLTADNATLAITGNVKPEFALKAVKRYFGGWLKADKKVPSTFAQPETPNEERQVIQNQTVETIVWREALRGFARNEKDYYASAILVKILRNRWLKNIPQAQLKSTVVRQDVHFLPSFIVLGNSYSKDSTSNNSENQGSKDESVDTIQVDTLGILIDQKVEAEEFEKAKSEVLAELNQISPTDWWLDIETFKLTSIKDEFQNFNNVTLANTQQVAEKLQKQPIVSVIVKEIDKETK